MGADDSQTPVALDQPGSRQTFSQGEPTIVERRNMQKPITATDLHRTQEKSAHRRESRRTRGQNKKQNKDKTISDTDISIVNIVITLSKQYMAAQKG